MTTPANTAVTLSLDYLDASFATFSAYVRADVTDAGAAGFGVEGAVRIDRRISREAWEVMGSPVVLPITLRVVGAEVAP